MTEESRNKPSLDKVIAIRLNLTVAWSGDQTDTDAHIGALPENPPPTPGNLEPVIHALKKQRGVLNDIHKRITGVSKGSRKQACKPNEINGRISKIWPYQKVWLNTQCHRQNNKHYCFFKRTRRRFRGPILLNETQLMLEKCFDLIPTVDRTATLVTRCFMESLQIRFDLVPGS